MKWVVLGSLIAAWLVQEPAPVVRTSSGLVRGRLSADGRHHQYFGIPYATVNDTNRFQAPLPPPTWDGVFEAIETNCRCPQKMAGLLVFGNTDCLKLYIYTPAARNTNELLPVMVFIHGGGFIEGTGSGFLYGGDFFVEHGVVLIGLNYRLNVEGFLCLGIKEAPGNAGLKDIIAALEWIKKNVRQFGGDPNNVTLFGESAGAASTSFLILSPAAKGLFHKAIVQSGSALAPWALQHDSLKSATSLAAELGYFTTDPHELYTFFKNKTPGELIKAVKNPKSKTFSVANMLFTPCVEKDIANVDSIITKHPEDIILSGNYNKVPMMVGFNDKDGIYLVGIDYPYKIKGFNVADYLPSDLEFSNENEKNLTIDRITKHYFPTPKENIVDEVVNLYSDLYFKYPTIRESELYAKTTEQTIHYYLFKYNGYINVVKMISFFWFSEGASHADELFYMFMPHSFPLPTRVFEKKMIKRMLTLWTNFAKYSEPTPLTQQGEPAPARWRPGRDSSRALHLGADFSTGPLWDDAAFELWSDIYSKYRKSFNYT